jgi:uncharacterized protein YcbX
MSEIIRGTIDAIYRYPVKGLTGERLGAVQIEAGAALPFDRAYAIENGSGNFDLAHPRHLPKIAFLMLMRHEQLAQLDARFDDVTHTLTLCHEGAPVAAGDLRTPEGRTAIEHFMQAFVPASMQSGRPRVVSAPGHSFSDVADKCLHIINLESVRALSTIMGGNIDPRRFRANLVIDRVPAWSELDWTGKSLTAGGARLSVFKRTERCAATNVDPASGVRDLKIPSLLSRTLGHTDFGIYARVQSPGLMREGDTIVG